MATCPTICNADIRADLMSSFTDIDTTQVVDTTCNSLVFLTDDAGLNDITDVLSGAWMSATTPRVKVVTSLSEVAAHFAVTSEVYAAAAEHFDNVGKRGVVTYYTLAFWDRGNETMVQALDAVNACNACWTHLVVTHILTDNNLLVDDAQMDAAADWAMANEKIGHFLTIDPLTKNPADVANFKARLAAAGVDDVIVYYTEGSCGFTLDPVTGAVLTFALGDLVVDHNGDPVIDPVTTVQRISDGTDQRTELTYSYIDMLSAGWAANVDFSQSNQDYSLAYKPLGGQGWVGVPVDIISAGDIVSVTGVNPDGTINANNNGYANVYVQNHGTRGMFRGLSVGGSYLDHIHLKLYARSQIRDALANMFANSRRIPYDDARGRQKLATAIESVLATLQRNGLLTNDNQAWEKSGAYVRKGIGWVIRMDAFADQSASRKSQRLAPQLRACIIPAGAVEHVPVTLCTLAQPQAV